MRQVAHLPRGRRLGWLDNDFDQFFNGFLAPEAYVADGHDLVPAVDVSETDDAYLVRAEMPGVRKEDIDITLEDGVLTLSAERKSESEAREGERLIRREVRYGKYLRSLRLGVPIDEDRIKASYADGVLALNLPKSEAAKPRKIEVGIG